MSRLCFSREALGWLIALVLLGALVIAATFPQGYLGSSVLSGVIYVNGTVRTLTVPDGKAAQYISLFNGTSLHPSVVPVYLTYGSAPVDPTIADPTAGNPTTVDLIDAMQASDIPGAPKVIKMKTDGTVCYVRYRIVY